MDDDWAVQAELMLDTAIGMALKREIQQAIDEEVRRIIAEVAAAFAAVRDGLVAALATLARLDASQARVLFGRACRGQLLTPGGDQLLLVAARHPLLDERLELIGR